ncbi:TPA: hypothetical protein ACNVSH_001992 [Klebsiella aerogenes]|uniref:hypothetical protein n=1 Tax=Klebsiella aerogenes TaxID=548 RepID=UPI0004A16284|nr:hypothetical protein [Klebsiella aerogenes]EKU4981491.1 hypothetical protein [Klebsiella aerogenes]KDF31015.1 hypothetical protein AE04_03143 [Klebsiella aerogenes MGH 78]KZQ59100.1 hypothetical protein A3N61_22720 [Klebsiella aerogenes]HBZ8411052.1 hypothetical protein [Klebsiella aerogenes]HCM5457719.1 hypothetical protein [Klebsiella aerogenes]
MLLMNQPEKHKIQKMNDEFKSLNLEQKTFIAKSLDVSLDEVDTLIIKFSAEMPTNDKSSKGLQELLKQLAKGK